MKMQRSEAGAATGRTAAARCAGSSAGCWQQRQVLAADS